MTSDTLSPWQMQALVDAGFADANLATLAEYQMLGLINTVRASQGLAPLRLELNLNTSADTHSQWMAETGTLSHEDADGGTATQRMLDAGMDLSGQWDTAENIAAVTTQMTTVRYIDMRRLHNELMSDPDYRANILDPDMTYIGIGLALGPPTEDADGGITRSLFVTQNFAYTDGAADLDLRLRGGTTESSMIGEDGDDYMVSNKLWGTLFVGGDGADTMRDAFGPDVLIGDDPGLYGSEISAQVYLLFDAAFGRAPTQEEHQIWGLELALNSQRLTDLAEQWMESPELEGLQAAASDAEFITALFQTVLGRDPAQAGLDAWAARLAGGMSRAEALIALSQSDENLLRAGPALDAFEAAHDPTVYSPQIYRLFEAVFGSAPEAEVFEEWMGDFKEGMTYEQAVTAFMATPEFTDVYGALDDVQFITALFTNVLGRPPAQAGLDAWAANLAGGMSREEVVMRFVDGPEFVLQTADALKDFMLGLGGHDVLAPGRHGSVLSGGAYSDTFLFDADSYSNHLITDFEPWDFVRLSGIGYEDVAEVREDMTQHGDDVVLYMRGRVVIFADTDLAEITDDQILI